MRFRTSTDRATFARRGVAWIPLLVLAASIFRGNAAIDIFLELPDIPGESTQAAHKDWISIQDVRFGQELNGLSTDPKVKPQRSFSEVRLLKSLDRSSPKLMKFCADGKKLASATIDFTRSFGKNELFYQVKLSGIIIKNVSVSGFDGDQRPTEELSIQYERIEWKYVQFVHNGFKLGAPDASWDVLNNTGTGGERNDVFKVVGTTKSAGNQLKISFVPQINVTYRLMVSASVTGPYTELRRFTVSQDKPVEDILIPNEVGDRFYYLEALLD